MTDDVKIPDVVAYAFLRYGQAAIAYGENPLPRFGECLDEARSSLHAEIAAALATERAAREAAEARVRELRTTVAFFASVIKCGEGWSEQCQQHLDAARQAGEARRKPCGECHLHPAERCDICGAVEPARQAGEVPDDE